MSRGHIYGFAEQGGHNVVVSGSSSSTKFQESYPGCTVTVFLAGTSTTATIYANLSDPIGTTKSNPFTSDATTAYWDFYAESTERYDVQFSGTGIGTAFKLLDVRVATDPTTTVNVKDYGALGDGVTNDFPAVDRALDVLAALDDYAELYFPPGVYILNSSLQINGRDRIRLRGAGMYDSILQCPNTNTCISVDFSQRRRVLTIEDLGFQKASGSATAVALRGTNESDAIYVRRCRFLGMHGLHLGRNVNLRVEDCVFQGLGQSVYDGISAAQEDDQGPVNQLVVSGCEFRYQRTGVNLNTTPETPGVIPPTTREPHQHVQIVGNYFDGGWYTQVPAFTGSPTAITATTVGISPAISSLPDGAYVRLMVPYGSGSSGTVTVNGYQLTDTAAHFVTWGVKRGAIVRLGSAFAIVESVQSETILWVEEWLSNSDRTPIVTPAAASYTVYRPIVGQSQAISSSTSTITLLTGTHWQDLDGNAVTPSTVGTTYEIQDNVGGHAIQLHRSVSRAVVDRNTVLRSQADQISVFGLHCRITNNQIEFGQDMGITLENGSGHLVADNKIIHQGANSIIVNDVTDGANLVITGNYCVDAMCVSHASADGACIRVEDSSNTLIANNFCERTSSGSSDLLYAVLIKRASSTTEKNFVTSNRAEGFSTSNPWFFVTGTGADKNVLLDNFGGYSASTDQAASNAATSTTVRVAEQLSAVAYPSASSVSYTAGAYAPLAFNTNVAEFDFGGVHSTSTNNTRFTAPADGLYLAIGQAFVNSGSAGQIRAMNILLTKAGGSTEVGWTYQPAAPSSSPWLQSLNVSALVQMKKGDYVQFQISADVNLTLQGGNRNSTFGSLAKL